ncbi:hypothetical protein Tco_1466440 [Tanacetum coccineum]
MVEGLESTGRNLVAIVRDVYVFVRSFTYVTDFVVLEDIREFIVSDMSEVVMGRPFRVVAQLEYDYVKGLILFTRIFDTYIFRMPRTIPKLKNFDWNKVPPILVLSQRDLMSGLSTWMAFGGNMRDLDSIWEERTRIQLYTKFDIKRAYNAWRRRRNSVRHRLKAQATTSGTLEIASEGSSQADVPDLISQELDARALKIIEELFKIHMLTQFLMCILQQAKYEKSSASTDPCRTDAFRKRDHDDHQGDDAHPKGEKDNLVVDEDEVIPGDETPEFINEFQNVDKRVLTIFDRKRIEAKLRDMLSNQKEDLKRPKLYALVFFGPQRNLNEPPKYLYNKDLFFLKHGNTTEKRYVLSLHKIHAVLFPEEDLEEKMNQWVKKEFKNFNEEARLMI